MAKSKTTKTKAPTKFNKKFIQSLYSESKTTKTAPNGSIYSDTLSVEYQLFHLRRNGYTDTMILEEILFHALTKPTAQRAILNVKETFTDYMNSKNMTNITNGY